LRTNSRRYRADGIKCRPEKQNTRPAAAGRVLLVSEV
jgi:hypothetical protein